MRRFCAYGLRVIGVVLAAPISLIGAAEFAELSRLLPEDANAVVVVNADALYNSPLGRRERWRQKFRDATETAPLLLPPTAQQCVLAAELDFNTLRPDWEAAAMRLTINPSIAEVARRRNGTVDVVSGVDVAWLGGRMCVARFQPRTFGLLTPASPQEAARWLDGVRTDQTPLAPYLQQAVSYADTAGTEMILAVDLDDVLRTSDIRARVAQSILLDDLNEEQATALLAGIRGVKLGVKASDQIAAKLELDFEGDTAMLAPIAKPLILAIVGESGAMLDEFNGWTAEASGKSLSLSGDLTPEGFRRIFSLLAVDAGAVDEMTSTAGEATSTAPSVTPPPAVTTTPADAQRQATIVASQRYFRAVSRFVADAQRLNRADSLRQSVMWLENYARHIENLSTRNVDPDLVKYGQYVAQTFRWVVDQAYGVEQKSDQINALSGPSEVRMGLLPTARTVNWGGYFMRQYAPFGWVQNNAEQQQRAAGQQQQLQDQIYKSVQEAQQTLTKLVADNETVRSQLAQRYGVEFR